MQSYECWPLNVNKSDLSSHEDTNKPSPTSKWFQHVGLKKMLHNTSIGNYKGGQIYPSKCQEEERFNTPEAIIRPVCGRLMWQRNNGAQSRPDHTHWACKWNTEKAQIPAFLMGEWMLLACRGLNETICEAGVLQPHPADRSLPLNISS